MTERGVVVGAREVPWRQLGLADRVTEWFDAAPDLFACVDADLRLVYTNLAFEAATGCSFTTCGEEPIADLRPFGDATDVVTDLLAEARDCTDREVAQVELTCCAGPTGAPRRYELEARADRDADGTVGVILLIARDVTQTWETEQSLRESQTEFRTLAENSPDVIIRYDLDGYAVYCNQEIAQRVNTSAPSVVGKRPTAFVPPGMVGIEEYERVLLEVLRTGAPGRVELTVQRPDGARATHSVLIRAERDAHGAITGAIAIGRDVSDLVAARQAAADGERRFRSLAENADDRIARWDEHGRFVYANRGMLEVLRLPAEEVFGRTIEEVRPGAFPAVVTAVQRVLAGGPRELVEQRFHSPTTGAEFIHQVLCVPEHDEDGHLVSVLGVGRDVTDAVRYREELERIASTDALTGLPNSQALYDRAPAILDAASRADRRAAVLLLDLDDFKKVNDTLGHARGDQVLRAVADQVHARLRSYDLFVRLGGDEFVIVVGDLETLGDLRALGVKVDRALAEVGSHDAVRTSASIGVAVFPEDGRTIEALVTNADMAMYQAKRSGRGRVEYFRQELSATLQRRSAIERALESPALTAQLELYLQPLFRMSETAELAGAEALLRWRHPTLGFVPPDEFIPIAEETGVIVGIGRWVLAQATAVAARWNRGRTAEPLTVAVNLSTRQFLLDDVDAAVAEAMAVAGCDPRWLVAEITESLLLEDSNAVQESLAALRERGIKLAVDDFGTGYSALHYLTRFPLDVLKIDRRFVQGLGATQTDELVKALVAMARALDLDVVAEGIETPAQRDFLAAQRCDLGQGFLLGRPVPITQFEAEQGLR